jgi:tetratricopeptide (TPR) repeat protein
MGRTCVCALSVLVGASAIAPGIARADAAPSDPKKPDAASQPAQPKADKQPATPAEREEAARTRFRRGVQLYDEGDYKLALVEFTRAYELAPNYHLLYNIGEVQLQLGRYASAMRSLKEYLQQGGADVPPDRRKDVERDIASLRQKTATFSVKVSVPGATVELDQETLGTAPIAPETVDGGEHRVRVTKPGYLPYEQTLVLGAGDVRDIFVTLVPLPTGGGPARPVERPSHPEIWISWIATGALAVGAGVTGYIALDNNSKLNTLRNTAGSNPLDRQNEADQARGFAIASDVLLAATAVSGAFALYFTFRHPATSTVNMGLGPGSLMLSGRF